MVSGRGHFAPAQHDTKYKTSTKPGFPLGTIKKLYIPVLVTPRPTSGGLCHKDSKIWTTPTNPNLVQPSLGYGGGWTWHRTSLSLGEPRDDRSTIC